MGSLLLLASATPLQVAQRVQSAGMNQILPASAVITRQDYVDSHFRKTYVDRRVNIEAELGDAGMDENINSEKQNKNKYSTLTQFSLRGIGTSRTLILLNGRRVVPMGNGAAASPDLSLLL
jgi:hypothetical protein